MLVRSTTDAGKITVTASAAGLKSDSVELLSQSVKVDGGLGQHFASDDLTPFLGRGPTPSGPSFQISRQPIDIVRATAGSNAATTAQSFDDDETTAWTSGRGAKKAWIAYELAKPATITEAVFKFSGWRQRSYPVRITVDGQEVFKSDTPKSLGYVTLPFKPVTGRTIKVELVGNANEKDEFKLVEVADQKIADTGANRLPNGVLSIIEAEFYEAAQPTAAIQP